MLPYRQKPASQDLVSTKRRGLMGPDMLTKLNGILAGASRLATAALDGLMSAAHFAKLDALPASPWHAGNDGAGSGLDADLLDGIDSARFVFGANLRSTTSVTDFNAITKSGFYDGNNAVGAPTANAWYHLIHNEHINGNYSVQFAVHLTNATATPTLYLRVRNNGTWYGWRAI